MTEAHVQRESGKNPAGFSAAARPRPEQIRLTPTSTMFTLAVPAWYVWTERRKPWNRLLPLFVFADWAYLWVSVFVLAHLLLLGQRICSAPPTSAGSAYLFLPTYFCWVSVFVLPHALLLGQRICSTPPLYSLTLYFRKKLPNSSPAYSHDPNFRFQHKKLI